MSSDAKLVTLYQGKFARTDIIDGGVTLERPVHISPIASRYIKAQEAREIARELIFAAEVADRAIETEKMKRCRHEKLDHLGGCHYCGGWYD